MEAKLETSSPGSGRQAGNSWETKKPEDEVGNKVGDKLGDKRGHKVGDKVGK